VAHLHESEPPTPCKLWSRARLVIKPNKTGARFIHAPRKDPSWRGVFYAQGKTPVDGNFNMKFVLKNNSDTIYGIL